MTDTDDPSRWKLRNETEEPKCTKSITAIDDPKRAKLLKETEAPR